MCNCGNYNYPNGRNGFCIDETTLLIIIVVLFFFCGWGNYSRPTPYYGGNGCDGCGNSCNC